jgi:hypothetical protein
VGVAEASEADEVGVGEAGVVEAACAACPAVELAGVQPAVRMAKAAASRTAGGRIRHSEFMGGTSLSEN